MKFQTYTINGAYGTNNSAQIHCMSTFGGTWYAIHGSRNVNHCTHVVLVDGMNVESITDDDTFQSDAPIADTRDLNEEVSEYLMGDDT